MLTFAHSNDSSCKAYGIICVICTGQALCVEKPRDGRYFSIPAPCCSPTRPAMPITLRYNFNFPGCQIPMSCRHFLKQNVRPWFLKFKNGSDGRGPLHHDGDGTYHHPVCDHNYNPPKCSDLFHSQTQTPGYPTGDGNCDKACNCGQVPCGMYLFDHRSKDVINGQSFTDWLVHNLTISETGLYER